MRVATPCPFRANGRSTADAGIVPSSRKGINIRVRIFVKRFIAILLFNIKLIIPRISLGGGPVLMTGSSLLSH
jgi:hypothetical protein